MLLMDMTFNVSHHLLAMKYRRIAKFMPLTLEGKKIDESMERKENKLYWGLLVPNMFFPLLDLAQAPWLGKFLAYEQTNPLTDLALGTCNLGISICQIISGVILITSVIKINGFLKHKNPTNVNVKSLVIHAIAFGFYLLCWIALFVMAIKVIIK